MVCSLDDISVTLAPTGRHGLVQPPVPRLQELFRLAEILDCFIPGLYSAHRCWWSGCRYYQYGRCTSSTTLILPEVDGLGQQRRTNVDALNNDEYQATMGSNLAPGTYYYASRWQLNGEAFKYGGYSSGGGFWMMLFYHASGCINSKLTCQR